MSGDTMYHVPKRSNVPKMRVHDYLFDSAYIVSGARDYARGAFKAAMASAQVVVQPVFQSMFTDCTWKHPRLRMAYYPNCRLPKHIDRSYDAYLVRICESRHLPPPDLIGKDRFKYTGFPKKLLATKSTSPDFQPPTPVTPNIPLGKMKPRNRGTQSLYRESSAQTSPWQPEGKAADTCQNTPEVLYLDKLEWGPGTPYRIGDLPADFHTTEIINKMRHARTWMKLVDDGHIPNNMKKRDAIITDVETKDWIFREAEIDELQDIRLELLHRIQQEERERKSNNVSIKLAKLWASKKQDMDRKIQNIRQARDRELRKLEVFHSGGGRAGQVQRMRAARGHVYATQASQDPTSDMHAPVARNGYQAKKRHKEIIYDPSLLSLEDHMQIAKPPAWLQQCGENLKKTCSGHHLPRDPLQLCERETKWSEQFLENLHQDLKKARMGAASASARPLTVLQKRRLGSTPRPSTPTVEGVPDDDEACHQAALVMQKVIRGRAVHNLMYEGRTRAFELTEELKSTHGLQKEDKIRIAEEDAKAKNYKAIKSEIEKRDNEISALVDELTGSAVSAALDFLEKELRRLKDERRQHAFILIALREKTMREAAEAGRRQKEEHRRREHDEMFKQIIGVTQETVDAYLLEVCGEGVELAAEADAVARAKNEADKLQAQLENEALSTAEQNELVAELVHQFLLPHAHKTASRHRISSMQHARMDAARDSIFGLIDDAEIKEVFCVQCGTALGNECRCTKCPITQEPQETEYRHDPRWKVTRSREVPTKSISERYPPNHEFRCMLNTLIDEVVVKSRVSKMERQDILQDCRDRIREMTEVTLDAKDLIEALIDRAMGVTEPPIKLAEGRHLMYRMVTDALARSEDYPRRPCPLELPSEVRRRADEEEAALVGTQCLCDRDDVEITSKVTFSQAMTIEKAMLPSELRKLEDMRRCKCDQLSPSTISGYTSDGNIDDATNKTEIDHEDHHDVSEEENKVQ